MKLTKSYKAMLFLMLSTFSFVLSIEAKDRDQEVQLSPLEKGSILMNGSFSYSLESGTLYRSAEDDKINIFSAFGYLDYFLFQNFAVGGKAGGDYLADGQTHCYAWFFGPQIMYFLNYQPNPLKKIQGSLYPYISLAYLLGKYPYYYYTYSYWYQNFNMQSHEYQADLRRINAEVGLMYMLNDSIAFTAALSSYWDRVESYYTHAGITGQELNAFLGFSFFLN